MLCHKTRQGYWWRGLVAEETMRKTVSPGPLGTFGWAFLLTPRCSVPLSGLSQCQHRLQLWAKRPGLPLSRNGYGYVPGIQQVLSTCLLGLVSSTPDSKPAFSEEKGGISDCKACQLPFSHPQGPGAHWPHWGHSSSSPMTPLCAQLSLSITEEGRRVQRWCVATLTHKQVHIWRTAQ